MTDGPESMGPVHEEPASEAAPGGDEFTSGEGLVALGGMVLLAVWVLFDVFLDEFGINTLVLLLSAIVVIVPRLRPEDVEKIHPVPVVMKMAGYALGIIGGFLVIGAIEGGFYDDGATIIAALITYVAYAMAFLGARQIDV